MSPNEIFTTLAVSEGFPREALVAAGECRDEMVPLFLDQIERLRNADADTSSEADVSAFLFVYYLLGEWRDSRAYHPLTALLRQDSDYLELLLGDAITEGTKRVIAGVFDGDLQPILDAIEDPTADQFVRCEMIDALVIIARQHPETRPDVEDYLERFFASDFKKPEILWGSWAFAVADLGLAHLEPQVREAFEKEWVSPEEADFDFFQQELRKSVEGGQSPWFHSRRKTGLIDSAIDELARWHCFSEAFLKARAKERASSTGLPQIFGDSFERETPKVGRNDPCPCGSGRKFKKCCLH
ncbi:DUF1186 domain-containing protein [Pararhodobacter sp. SW119]|uniref:DUF1186 domain-containing protein n=1 Tax=Pararhodobacter sp. SW119 TaxID=2780075 RepID=UPI001FD854D4|nr:DUF1186 domain-containing protein [Pararhodobacter sp. SW119]